MYFKDCLRIYSYAVAIVVPSVIRTRTYKVKRARKRKYYTQVPINVYFE